ncbi:MAG: hypothetical protein DWI11_06655 [Planctomycetota bacterium]|nr:MAG: hypothetical protein DWI11_06655 [Planctomycetota bacterium]
MTDQSAFDAHDPDLDSNLDSNLELDLTAALDALGAQSRQLSPEAIARIARVSAASLPSNRSSSDVVSSLRWFNARSTMRYAVAAGLIAAAAVTTALVLERNAQKSSSIVTPREVVMVTPSDTVLPQHVETALARVASLDERSRSSGMEAALLQLASLDVPAIDSSEPFAAVLGSRAVSYDEFEAEMRDLAGDGSTF